MQRSQAYQSGKGRHLGARILRVFENDTNRILALLLLVDVAFIIIHIRVWTTFVFDGYLSDENFLITQERGFGEIYQYVKEFWLVVLFLWLAIRHRAWPFAVWALLFGYVLYDDLFWVHEIAGGWLAAFMHDLRLPGGVRAVDVGELMVFLLAGLAFFPLLMFTYWRSSLSLRTIHRRLFVLISILFCVAAGADFAHSLNQQLWGDLLFGIIEDGGELVIMSVTFWYVFRLSGQPITSIRSPSVGD